MDHIKQWFLDEQGKPYMTTRGQKVPANCPICGCFVYLWTPTLEFYCDGPDKHYFGLKGPN